MLEIEPPNPSVGTVVKPFTLTIRDQMNLIERILRYRPNISFKRMLRRARDRVEIIVTFLAVLELLRRQKVEVVQEQLFGDILIVPIEKPALPEGTAIPDEEESAFEIPKVEAEEPLAEEFEFEADSVDRGLGIGEQAAEGTATTKETQEVETTSDGSTHAEDQQIPEPGAETSAGPDRPDA
ncbi:MAG: segregation/condensation protein A [Chloroflexi bacterium]|nr:segregation/condensation protein A [Chloroflexota bacterium]